MFYHNFKRKKKERRGPQVCGPRHHGGDGGDALRAGTGAGGWAEGHCRRSEAEANRLSLPVGESLHLSGATRALLQLPGEKQLRATSEGPVETRPSASTLSHTGPQSSLPGCRVMRSPWWWWVHVCMCRFSHEHTCARVKMFTLMWGSVHV